MSKFDIDPQCEEYYGTYQSEPANEDSYEEVGEPYERVNSSNVP